MTVEVPRSTLPFKLSLPEVKAEGIQTLKIIEEESEETRISQANNFELKEEGRDTKLKYPIE